MTFQKKKKGEGYVVTWDSDGSSDSDDSSDDGKKYIKKSTSKHRHQQQAHHVRHSIDKPHGKAYQGKI